MTQLISMTKISSAFKPYTDKWLKVLREISDPKRGTGTARASVILLGDQAPEVKQGTHRLISDEPPAIEGSDMGRLLDYTAAIGFFENVAFVCHPQRIRLRLITGNREKAP